MSTRYDIRNGIGLCSYCHTFSSQGFEQSPYSAENLQILEEKIGEQTLSELQVESKKMCKRTLNDFILLERQLKEKLDEISNQRQDF